MHAACNRDLTPLPYGELEALVAARDARIAEREALVAQLRSRLGRNSRNLSASHFLCKRCGWCNSYSRDVKL